MNDQPLVSFVVPCYRCHDTIAGTLESIQRQQGCISFEIIVVVSGWNEESPPQALVGETILLDRARLLPGAARNRGAKAALGGYLAFVDADAVLEANWLGQMLETLQTQSASMIGGFIRNANPEEIASRILHLVEFSEYLPGLPAGFRSGLSTSNCLLELEEFRRLGGFDEQLAMSEDWEFSKRLGAPLYFCPSSGIAHQHRSTWEAVGRHLRELGFWSGRLRRQHPDLSGSWLRLFPPACFGLLLLRLCRIQRRLGQARLGSQYRRLGDVPHLLLGLLHWTIGFWQGVRKRFP